MLSTYNRLRVITTPTATAAQILSCQEVHVPVMPVSCGVDTDIFTPAVQLDRTAACARFGLNPHKILFLYVGRLDGEKRIDLLLKAFAELRGQGRSDVQLAIAGQGAAENDLKALARSLKLEDAIKFLGYVPGEELPRLYQTGQLFVMPSPEELQSIATLEAMASGRPVLASNARALPELVGHMENGYLFHANKVDSVACGMAFLADHPEEWDQMGKNSRARAVHHSLAKTIRRYEEIYSQVISAG